MNVWTSLIAIELAEWFAKGTAELAEALNKRIAALLAGRAAVDEEDKALRAAAPAEIASTVHKRAGANRAKRMEVLASEASLREDLKALDRQRRVDLAGAQKDAGAALEKAKVDIEHKLVKLGYRPPSSDVADPGKVQPGWILAHPTVRALYERSAQLGHVSSDYTALQANKVALEAVEAELLRLRDLALAG